MTSNINGIDVSECKLYDYGICDSEQVENLNCEQNPDCYFKQFKRLQEENEKIKKQYNCYACGNCTGTEDYINLEKHHKGLRKQFDEFVKRNNTLSLRIEELEKENKELKFALDMFNKACKKINVENIEKSFNTYIEYTKNLKKENEELKKRCEEWALETVKLQGAIDGKEFKIDKYKQALEEIREVINCSDKNDCDNCPRNDFCEELCDSKENLIYVLKTMI